MSNLKCTFCECEKDLIPIFELGTNNGDESDFSDEMICEECLEENEDFGKCALCNEVAVYHMEDLKGYSGELYCEEHYAEVAPGSEEETEDMSSYMEYVTDPSHERD